MSRRTWTDEQIALMIKLRDVEGLPWNEIGERFGFTAAKCCIKYHNVKSADRIAARRKEMRVAAGPPAAIPARGAELRFLNEPVARPRYFSDADQFIRARIERQGLTAGFLGDPPPGRSALDEKRAGVT